MRLWPIAALWITSTLAILGAEKRVQWLQVVFKPLTTLLFFAVIGRPETTFARWVTAGIALSVIGDIALLSDSNRAFMVGLVAFLLAHIAYVIAFVGVAAWSPHVAIVAIVIVAASSAAAARDLEGRGRAARRDDRLRGRHQRDGHRRRRRRSAGPS